MEQRNFEVGKELAGRTVLRVVHDLAGITHATARGILAAGGIRRNGRTVARADERVEPGDRVELTYDSERRYRAPAVPPPAEGYKIVHEDRELLVADKEPGLLTVPTPSGSGDSLSELLVASYRARGHRDPTVIPVHRIDRFTSGLVAFARTGHAGQVLREQFAATTPERVYFAVAHGRLARDHDTLEHHLEENPKSLKVHTVPRGGPGGEGRRAVCSYRVVERFTAATLVEVRLETGRRNQIRVQLAAIGHPLLGDHTYGKPSALLARTALHAGKLAFDHPTSGSRVTFLSPLPADFEKMLTHLRREDEAAAQSPTSTRTPV